MHWDAGQSMFVDVDVDVYVASAFDFAQIALNGCRFNFNFDSEHVARASEQVSDRGRHQR